MPTFTLSFAPHTRTADAAVRAPRKNLRVVRSDTCYSFSRQLYQLARNVFQWIMRVAVFHQTGFIAPHVVRALRDRGHDVVDADAEAVICAQLFTESDAAAAVDRFRGRTGKLVVLSSGDVYRAYGKLQRTEPGDLEPIPITEDSPLRTVLYPYRDHPKYATYEKILVERTVMAAPDLPACVLRLPAVYGPGDRHRRFGDWIVHMLERRASITIGAGMAGWRWTHGYVENVAAAIAVAATDPRTAGSIYNIGEHETDR